MTIIIGFGKLAQSVVSLLPIDQPIHVYSRTKEKVIAASKENPKINWIDLEDVHNARNIWLFLPQGEIEHFLVNHRHFFSSKTILHYTATSLTKADIQQWLPDEVEAVPCKFVTQADQLRKDGFGLAAVDPSAQKYTDEVTRFLGSNFTIVLAPEQDVLAVNKTATKQGIEAVIKLKRELKKKQIDDVLITNAAKQIIPGVIHSYLNDNLGGFGQKAVKEITDET